eukprot:1194364-Prorocentrum_minimum.AAC.2
MKTDFSDVSDEFVQPDVFYDAIYQVKACTHAGKLLSDETILSLLLQRFEKGAANGERGFILDGFPRTLHQAVRTLQSPFKRDKSDRAVSSSCLTCLWMQWKIIRDHASYLAIDSGRGSPASGNTHRLFISQFPHILGGR